VIEEGEEDLLGPERPATVVARVSGESPEQASTPPFETPSSPASSVWLVERTTGAYEQEWSEITAAFRTEAAARAYEARMKTHRGWPGESGGGDEDEWSVYEIPVWEDAPERVVLLHRSTTGGRGYRTETYVPAGWEPDDPAVIVVGRMNVEGAVPAGRRIESGVGTNPDNNGTVGTEAVGALSDDPQPPRPPTPVSSVEGAVPAEALPGDDSVGARRTDAQERAPSAYSAEEDLGLIYEALQVTEARFGRKYPAAEHATDRLASYISSLEEERDGIRSLYETLKHQAFREPGWKVTISEQQARIASLEERNEKLEKVAAAAKEGDFSLQEVTIGDGGEIKYVLVYSAQYEVAERLRAALDEAERAEGGYEPRGPDPQKVDPELMELLDPAATQPHKEGPDG